MESVATPDDDDDAAEGPDAATRVIWDAVDGVARTSQQFTQVYGHMVRIEAARTDPGQSPTGVAGIRGCRQHPAARGGIVAGVDVFRPQQHPYERRSQPFYSVGEEV